MWDMKMWHNPKDSYGKSIHGKFEKRKLCEAESKEMQRRWHTVWRVTC